MSKRLQPPKAMDMKIKQYRLLSVQGRRLHVATLLSFFLLASCGGDDLPSDKKETDTPIGFSSTISPQEKMQTRAGIITDITSMYVFASHTGTANWATTNTPNFMYKQLMEKSGGNWTYTPLKYWPNSTNDKISFFAYAPVNLTGLTLSGNNVAGPTLTYVVPTNESSQQDLLASSLLNRTKTTGTVSFSMKHTLTQVKFKVKKEAAGSSAGTTDNTTITLTGLQIVMPGVATLSFTASADNAFSWSLSSTQSTFSADAKFTGSNISLTTTPAEVAAFFLLPVGDPSQSVTLKLIYTLAKTSGSNTGTSIPITSAISLPATPVWNSGSSIVYTVSVVDDRLEISEATSVKDFNSSGDDTVTDIPAN